MPNYKVVLKNTGQTTHSSESKMCSINEIMNKEKYNVAIPIRQKIGKTDMLIFSENDVSVQQTHIKIDFIVNFSTTNTALIIL